MITSEYVVGGIVVALTLLSILVSILRMGQGGAVNQLRGLVGLVSAVGLIVLVIVIAVIFHNVQSKIGPTNGPNVGYPTQTTIPSYSGGFATPSVPPLTR
jgi:hypothetical protein